MAKITSGDLSNLKWTTANEAGVNLKEGYNGDLPAKDTGRIGGQMVRKMIQYAQSNMPELNGTRPGKRT